MPVPAIATIVIMTTPTKTKTKAYSHRTFLELSVGTTHTLECIIHMQRADLDWFNAPEHISDHQRQLFALIGRRILPQECSEEIEADLATWRQKRAKIGVLIGEKNIAEAAAAVKAAAAAKAAGGKGGVGAAGGRGKKGAGKKGVAGKKSGGKSTTTAGGKTGAKSGSKTTLVALAGGVGGKKAKRKRDTGDISYLFAETLQVTYRVEDIKTSDSATLLYTKNITDRGKDVIDMTDSSGRGKWRRSAGADGSTNKGIAELATFRTLKKLSKRIIIWVYPFDSANPTASNPGGGGFPRPAMIPLTSLFVERHDDVA